MKIGLYQSFIHNLKCVGRFKRLYASDNSNACAGLLAKLFQCAFPNLVSRLSQLPDILIICPGNWHIIKTGLSHTLLLRLFDDPMSIYFDLGLVDLKFILHHPLTDIIKTRIYICNKLSAVARRCIDVKVQGSSCVRPPMHRARPSENIKHPR